MTQRQKSSRLLVEQLEDRLTPAGSQIPAGEFNWTQYSPDGTLGQLIWDGQSLVYRTRSGDAWQADVVATSDDFTRSQYDDRDQMQAASQSAQLVYTADGTPHALFLEKQYDWQSDSYQTLIRHYTRTGGDWSLVETITPQWRTVWGPNNLVAEAGPDNTLHLVFTETTTAATGVGQFGAGTVTYATNTSGTWTFEKIANTTDLTWDVWFLGGRYAPRFLSLAVDGQGNPHVTYTPEFYISGAFGTVHSDLMYATNAGGNWHSELIIGSLDGTADAGLGASIAISPSGQIAVASYYVDRFTTGSPQASWLLYSTRDAGGVWTNTTVVSSPDGYVGGDGPHFTGFAPQLSFDANGQPTIVFSDEAGEHLPESHANEVAGQIRLATLVDGSWVTTTVFRQTDPLVNQLFFPIAATYNGQTVYAGALATSVLDGNRNPTQVNFALMDVNAPTITVPPVVVPPVIPPAVPPTLPPTLPAPSDPPASPPALPPSVPPAVPPTPPPTVPPAVPPTVPPPLPPPVSPPPAPPAVPALVSATEAGVTTVVRVSYSDGSYYGWTPFGAGFSGGATVARGDVNRDGVDDIIVASGAGAPGRVKVYDGATRDLLATYSPFGAFAGGLVVAAGDVNRDGVDDIAVGVAGGGAPLVEVIDGATGDTLRRFTAYPAVFTGGLRIGVGDVNADGFADVVVAPGDGPNLRVRVFDGETLLPGDGPPRLLGGFFALGTQYVGGESLAVGDVDGDGHADIIVGTETGGGRFQVFSGATVAVGRQPTPMVSQSAGLGAVRGIRLGLSADSDGDGLPEMIVTAVGGERTVRFLSSRLSNTGWATDLAEWFDPMPEVNAGVYVG